MKPCMTNPFQIKTAIEEVEYTFWPTEQKFQEINLKLLIYY